VPQWFASALSVSTRGALFFSRLLSKDRGHSLRENQWATRWYGLSKNVRISCVVYVSGARVEAGTLEWP